MKLNFALSLSFQGISLLGRVPGGWAVLGEVALDTEDLRGSLEDLRRIADARGANKGQVKLIIPNGQIRYLDLPMPDGESDRDNAIRRALDGATPYAVSDLVYDSVPSGSRLMVAAVASETLDEAENFARGHFFEPVSFVAWAPEGQFPGEVLFGTARSWNGSAPTRDISPTDILALPEEVEETTTPADPTDCDVPVPNPRPASLQNGSSHPQDQAEIGSGSATVAARDGPAETEKTSERPEPDKAAPAAGPASSVSAQARPPALGPDAPIRDEAETVPPAALTADEDAALAPGAAASDDRPGAIAKADTPLPAFVSLRASRELSKTAADRAPLLGAAARGDGGSGSAPSITQAESGQPSRGPLAGASLETGLSVGKAIPATGPVAASATAAPIASLSRPAMPAADLPDPETAPTAAQGLVKGFFSRRSTAQPAPTRVAQPAGATGEVAQRRSAKTGAGSATTAAAIPKLKPRSAPASDPAAALSAERKAPIAATGAATDATAEQDAERQRMTVFGARQSDARVGGKPRFLGLMLTAVLLLFLAGVAAWASVFFDEGLARFFRPDVTPKIETANAPAQPGQTAPEAGEPPRSDGTSPEPTVSEQTGPDPLYAAPVAELPPRSGSDGPPSPAERPRSLTAQEANATYAATGIWQRAPVPPLEPQQTEIENLYVASIDPDVQQFDAVALPAAQVLRNDLAFDAPRPPLPAGVTFDLDQRGFVRATPEGALNPDGIVIYAGLPPVVPPRRSIALSPAASNSAPSPAERAEDEAEQSRLRSVRPRPRPGGLIERNERANLSGASIAELAELRPKLRPEVAKQDEEDDTTATDLAIAQSVKPLPRPRDIERIVEAARAVPEPARAEPVQVAAVAPRTVTPSNPSRSSVTQQATVRNAINLRQVNLIGVYGKPSSRRALVRLSNGRYQKVKVGDSIDGGRVAAIGESELRYSKGGRNYTLKMPQG